MNVFRGDTKDGLSAEQAGALERWLFEESPVATYEQARVRLQRDYGVWLSNGAVGNFYQKRAKARMMETAVALGKAGHPAWGQLGKSGVEAHRYLLEVAGRLGFDLATSGEKLTLNELTKLVRLAATALAADQGAKRLRLKEAEVQLKGRLVAIQERAARLKEKGGTRVEAKEKVWEKEERMAA